MLLSIEKFIERASWGWKLWPLGRRGFHLLALTRKNASLL